MEARLELKLSQKLIMTPQLQQAIKAAAVVPARTGSVGGTQELTENPVLEEYPRSDEIPDGELRRPEVPPAENSPESLPEEEGARN